MPKQAPRAKAQTKGCKGRSSFALSANFFTTGIIIVVKGILSMKAEASPDTHKINKRATASLKVVYIFQRGFKKRFDKILKDP